MEYAKFISKPRSANTHSLVEHHKYQIPTNQLPMLTTISIHRRSIIEAGQQLEEYEEKNIIHFLTQPSLRRIFHQFGALSYERSQHWCRRQNLIDNSLVTDSSFRKNKFENI